MNQLAAAPAFLSYWSHGEAQTWTNPIDYLLVERVIGYLEKAAVFEPPATGKAALLGTTFLTDKPWLVQEAEVLAADVTGYGLDMEGVIITGRKDNRHVMTARPSF